MTQLRAQKVAGIEVPDLEVDHQEGADVLVLSWGGTYGPVTAGVRRVRTSGGKVSHAHLRWLNPFPRNLGDVLRSYDRVLDPRDEPGPPAASSSAPSSSSTRAATTACAASRSRPPRSPTPIEGML